MTKLVPLAGLRCKEATCVALAKVKYEGYCLDHYRAKEYAALRNKKADIQRFSLMGFTPEEVEELAHIDISEVYKLQEQLEKEISPLLQFEIKERLLVLANKVVLAHELRVNELWIIVRTGDPKSKVSALKQLQIEEAHHLSMLQQLGQVPKVAEKLEVVESSAEQLVNKMEGRVLDAIPVRRVFNDDQEDKIKLAMRLD